MYKTSWNKGKLYWFTVNEYGDLPLPLLPWPVNEKKQSILYSRAEVNVKVALEFRNENVYF